MTEFAAEHVGVEDTLPGPCPVCGSRVGVRFPTAFVCARCEWRWGDVPDGDLAPRGSTSCTTCGCATTSATG
ncbi:hypothetical protein QP157_15050 [Sphingomonas sp. LR61]|uniref:hypothetical protein n=1 Tax=Sphingomonas sp. LR61 TaxID=3050234 RepID=UPI002FE32E18